MVKVLQQTNEALGQINSILPMTLLAYSTLHTIWLKANPEKSFEEFNAELLAGSLDVQATSEAWFAAHGFYQDESGAWVKR